MKKVGKAIGFIYLVLLVLIFVCAFAVIYGVCNTRTTIFQNKYYNSIEELAEATGIVVSSKIGATALFNYNSANNHWTESYLFKAN